MTDALTYALSSLRRAAEDGFPWGILPDEARALVAEVERLRGEVAWLRSPILRDEVCAACGHAKWKHHDYRDREGQDVTKCWGGGFDCDDCASRCERFVRASKEGT